MSQLTLSKLFFILAGTCITTAGAFLCARQFLAAASHSNLGVPFTSEFMRDGLLALFGLVIVALGHSFGYPLLLGRKAIAWSTTRKFDPLSADPMCLSGVAACPFNRIVISLTRSFRLYHGEIRLRIRAVGANGRDVLEHEHVFAVPRAELLPYRRRPASDATPLAWEFAPAGPGPVEVTLVATLNRQFDSSSRDRATRPQGEAAHIILLQRPRIASQAP